MNLKPLSPQITLKVVKLLSLSTQNNTDAHDIALAYEAHVTAAVIIFTMIVTFAVAALLCMKNYVSYLLMCRTDEVHSKTLPGELAIPKAVRLRDSGTPGIILRSLDSGISWTEVKLPTDAKIIAAKAPSPEAMYVMDSEGKAYKSEDYGEEWIQDVEINESNFNEL